MRRHTRDDHEGPQAHARDRGGARRGRAGCRGRRLSLTELRIADLFDRVAGTYDRAVFPFFTQFAEALLERVDITSDESVLDVGCGTGAALVPAAARAARAVGIDISPGMVARAREAAPDAEVLVGDATALPFGDESFDVVLSAFVVFFFPDPTAALTEWRRVLKPGGRVALSTWGSPDERWSWERDLRRRYADKMPRNLVAEAAKSVGRVDRFESPDKVAAELRVAGFEPEEAELHSIEFRYPDEQAWWDWNLSHAARAMVDALPDDAREAFRADAFEAMQVGRAEDGAFPRSYTAVFAVARSVG